MNKAVKKVSFQGELGAYSHLALSKFFGDVEAIACLDFKQAMDKVVLGSADTAMIPVENSQWGRVTDVHFLLPKIDLVIVGEYFHRVQHKLLGCKDSNINDITHVYSHPQALGQCLSKISSLGITAVPAYDTAGAARLIADKKDITQAAIASELAAEIYGLKILASDFEDAGNNTTRFIIMQKSDGLEKNDMHLEDNCSDYITAFFFATRNIPASLYKVLGGFATNGVNMIRLESYQDPDKFQSSCFYAEIIGHTKELRVENAFQELSFFASEFKILGTFKADSFRISQIK